MAEQLSAKIKNCAERNNTNAAFEVSDRVKNSMHAQQAAQTELSTLVSVVCLTKDLVKVNRGGESLLESLKFNSLPASCSDKKYITSSINALLESVFNEQRILSLTQNGAQRKTSKRLTIALITIVDCLQTNLESIIQQPLLLKTVLQAFKSVQILSSYLPAEENRIRVSLHISVSRLLLKFLRHAKSLNLRRQNQTDLSHELQLLEEVKFLLTNPKTAFSQLKAPSKQSRFQSRKSTSSASKIFKDPQTISPETQQIFA